MPFSAQSDLLQRLCSGKLAYKEVPTASPRAMKFFIASAYSDFKVEREVLKQRVYPELIEYGKSNYGLDVEVVDPRENDLDIQSEGDYRSLFNELRDTFCHCTSDCCPVILIGQKYGLPILPERIPSRVFQLLLSTLRAHRNHLTKDYHVLNSWYKLDDNSTPDSSHLLLHQNIVLKGKDIEKEWPKQRRLLATLLKLGFVFCLQEGTVDQALVEDLLVFELETSVNQAMASSAKACGKHAPILLRREIIDINNYLNAAAIQDFLDVESTPSNSPNASQVDSVLHRLHAGLDRRLVESYPYTGDPYRILWRFPTGVDLQHHAEYLNNFCDEFKRAAMSAIDERGTEKVLHEQRLQTQVFDTCYNSLTRSAMMHQFSVGHEDTMAMVLEYCYSTASQPFIIHGPQKSGKSVVMSGVYEQLMQIALSQPSTVLLHRVFMERSTLSEFVESLYQQIAVHCHHIATPYTMPASKTLQDFFTSLPENINIIILISGFERLVDDFGQSLILSSVFPASLPRHVKFVLTFMATGVDERFHAFKVREFSYSEYNTFLVESLQAHGRQLTAQQQASVRSVLPSVENFFHLSLLMQQLMRLTSFDDMPVAALMGESVEQAVEFVFKQLEKKYGRPIISKIALLINASQDGLTDNELTDLLSLDDSILLHEVNVNHYVLQEDTFHFSRSKFQAIKRELHPLICTYSRDAFFVSYWSVTDVSRVVENMYGNLEVKSVHTLMNEYYQGHWHQCFKPVKVAQQIRASSSSSTENKPVAHQKEKSMDRLVPSQEIMYGTQLEPHFNVRLYRQLPRHLTAVGAEEELNKKVLFNYEWIYYKTKCLGLNELISDYQSMASSNVAIALVLQAIEKSRPILEENMDCLAAELIGQILAFSSMYEHIRHLVQQCDMKGPKHNGILPSFSYPSLPGSALENVLHCPAPLQSYYVDEGETSLRLKMAGDSLIYQYDLTRHELSHLNDFSHGRLVGTHSQRYTLLLDDVHENVIKVHEKLTGHLLGQVMPTNWIETRPFEVKKDYKIVNLDVAQDLLCVVLAHKVSYVFIVDLQTCAPVHMFRPEKRATLCKLSPDGTFLFTNSGQQLVGFNIATKEQTALIDLLAVPHQMHHSKDMQRAFLLCDQDQVVVNLHLRQGHVEMSYKVVFEKSLLHDSIQNVHLSTDDVLLLVQAKQNILVYEFVKDTIICHFKRPAEIPRYFKLPNCEYSALNFTCANFAMENKAVIASVFRNILIWSVETSAPLALLHAPVGIISDFVVCHERKCLVGYVSTSQNILVWNLENTFSDGSVIDALTQSVHEVSVAANNSCALAMCEASDELGIIDLATGFLTDLYTHEGKVAHCCVSACGKFALVGIQPKRRGAANFIWSLRSRRIIHEFGQVSGHYLPLTSGNDGGPHFVYIGQEEAEFGRPFVKILITCRDPAVEGEMEDDAPCQLNRIGEPCAYALKPPFLSRNEKYLAILSAKSYIPHRDAYEDHIVCVTSLDTGHESQISMELLNNFAPVGAILDIRSMEEEDTGVLILYRDSGEASNSFGGLIWDMANMGVLQHFPSAPYPDPTSLHFSDNVEYFLDKENNLFLYGNGVPLYALAPKDVTFRGFFLHNRAVLFSKGDELMAYRLPERTLIGKVHLPAVVSCVSKCKDERTAVIGCESGHVLSFTLVDPLIDDVSTVVAGIKSRVVVDTARNRSWDRSLPGTTLHPDENLFTEGPRSPHSKSSGMSRDEARRKLKELARDFDMGVDDAPSMAYRSKSCSLM